MTQIIDLFAKTLLNLKVDNADQIKARRDEITKALNRKFRNSESSSANRLMVGSWGRRTAINGVSDLDMIYILPAGLRSELRKEGGPRKALEQVKEAITAHYSTTSLKLDRLVVVAQFANYKFEVQPCFEGDDGSFEYPDTYTDSWKRTDPRLEIEAMRVLNDSTSGNARDLCRLARAWKLKHAVPMNGLLIDTLVWKFFQQTSHYTDATLLHGHMVLEFFTFLTELPKQKSWGALGSNQSVKAKKSFQQEAKKAATLCQEAIDAAGKASMHAKWRKVFGRFTPASTETRSLESEEPYKDTEEFIEDFYPLDNKYELNIDCTVTQNGFRPMRLRDMLRKHIFLRPQKQLTFTVTSTTVPEPYELRWKVLNRGQEAERRNQVRGQIFPSTKRNRHEERTLFRGDHYVECYAIRDGVVVARAHVDVPIHPETAQRTL